MTQPSRLVAAPSDPRGRLVAIFVGAVLLPSVALSVVLFYLIPRHAETTKIALYKRAEKTLAYIEKDLELAAHAKALQAARLLGAERLLEARPAEIRARLADAGLGDPVFESLHLEVSSPRAEPGWSADHDLELEALREALAFNGALPRSEFADWVELPAGEFEVPGTLHFQYACTYAHGKLLEHYFEKEFMNPGGSMVIRVTEPGGRVVYETAPTPKGEFEVKRHMTSPSFRGLSLALRYRERSIAEDVQRWKMGTLALIGFIDLMLGAGLYLVYSNVRREIHLSRLKSDFVANVSHELKTPLSLIRLFAETLELGRVASPEKTSQYYRVISKESQRLTQLINNILDFSRIEAGRKEYNFAPADIARIVDEVIDTYRFQIEQQGFELDVRVAKDLPEVVVDKEALGQALINLVNNAIKFSRDQKYLGLEVRQDGDRVLMTVRDRGIGVAKGELKRIFDKFYRAEDSLVHETKGSGLGLALVRHIMEAHGGEVLVESAPGRGSSFTLVLPLDRGK
jgi:signal transduction histidine kinase